MVLRTPHKKQISAKTIIYTQINDGASSLNEAEFDESRLGYNCSENFHGRITKLTLTFSTKDNFLDIYYDTDERLHFPCTTDIKVPYISGPFKVGISSLNGLYGGNPFKDHVEIYKLSMFNLNIPRKAKFIPTEEKGENDSIAESVDEEVIDLIEEFQSTKNETGTSPDEVLNFLTNLSQKLHTFTMEKKRTNLDSRNRDSVLENTSKKLKELREIMQKKDYKEIVEIANKLELNFLASEIDKINQSWESSKRKGLLSQDLNELLSDQVDNLITSLKSSEAAQRKISRELVG